MPDGKGVEHQRSNQHVADDLVHIYSDDDAELSLLPHCANMSDCCWRGQGATCPLQKWYIRLLHCPSMNNLSRRVQGK